MIAARLAATFVAGPWHAADLEERGRVALGRAWPWLGPLARRILAAFPAGPRPTAARLSTFLREDEGFRRACNRRRGAPKLRATPGPPPVMGPAAGPPSTWPVPEIVTTAALADRLGLAAAELDWFADLRASGPGAGPGPLRHYDCRWVAKAHGSARLIEAPRPRLKAIQRRLLDEILIHVPPHDAAHGFRAGRSVRTYAGPHVGRRVVLKLDLRDFFPAIAAPRVVAIFLTAGYPEPVARALAGLCTSRVPPDAWVRPDAPARGPETWRLRRLYDSPHLPQGAPTSPALANLCAYRLDARLAGLAAAAGASYTRYADDLAFSGGPDFERSVARFHVHVLAVAIEEGFAVQPRKTRVMRRGVRQRVAGVVVNERPNVARGDFDALKATLHNCLVRGPHGQDRTGHPDFRAHLAGRVAHVGMLNPDRGRKLKAMLDRIAW